MFLLGLMIVAAIIGDVQKHCSASFVFALWNANQMMAEFLRTECCWCCSRCWPLSSW